MSYITVRRTNQTGMVFTGGSLSVPRGVTPITAGTCTAFSSTSSPVTVDGCSPVQPGHGQTHDGPTMLGRTTLNRSRHGAGAEQGAETPRPPASVPSSRSRPPTPCLSAASLSSFRLCARSALTSRCSPRALVKVYVFGYPRSAMASAASFPAPPAVNRMFPFPPPPPPATPRGFAVAGGVFCALR